MTPASTAKLSPCWKVTRRDPLLRVNQRGGARVAPELPNDASGGIDAHALGFRCRRRWRAHIWLRVKDAAPSPTTRQSSYLSWTRSWTNCGTFCPNSQAGHFSLRPNPRDASNRAYSRRGGDVRNGWKADISHVLPTV